MKQFKIILYITVTMLFIGCSGGVSIPSDDDNISVVKVTDLRLGYLARGLIRVDDTPDYMDFHYDLGFCNNELTLKVYGDYIDDHYGVGTYEIAGESIIVYANGDVIIDTGDSGTLQEGRTYLIDQPTDNLNWQIGSISAIEDCILEPI